MKTINRFVTGAAALLFSLALVGCGGEDGGGSTDHRPFDKPEFVTIKPDETGFFIHLDEDTGNQKQWYTSQFLKDKKVATRRVQIRHKWISDGFRNSMGHYAPLDTVIVVNLAPVTREWTSSSETGSTAKNQSFHAETAGSTSFAMDVSCSVQVDEANAALFVGSFSGQPLETVMDRDIRPVALGALVAAAGKFDVYALLKNKPELNAAMQKAVGDFCKAHGLILSRITISSDVTWTQASVQTSLDKIVEAEAEEKAQGAINRREIERAQASAKASAILSSATGIAYTRLELKRMELENQRELIKVMGQKGLPQAVGINTIISKLFEPIKSIETPKEEPVKTEPTTTTTTDGN